MATPGAVIVVDEGDDVSLISWGAVIAGGIASAAISLLLLAFGVGIGLSVISPWANEGVSATTFHIGSGVFLIVVAMLSSTVGGLIAGRMRARWVRTHRDEVFFRDTAHGFLSWAVAVLLSAAALGTATTSVLSSASTGLIPAAGAASAAISPSDLYIDALLRTDAAPATAAPGSPAAAPSDVAATRAEVGRIFTANQRRRTDISAADRGYLARVVSARTGLSQADAEKRVTEVTNQAKTATDQARKAAAKLSLWLAASMLAGAFAASLAATEGGAFRDERWYEPGWKRTSTF